MMEPKYGIELLLNLAKYCLERDMDSAYFCHLRKSHLSGPTCAVSHKKKNVIMLRLD